MNTVGKILVILNFLFAVIVGAFLVVDFATRTSWKTEYDNLKKQLVVIDTDRQTWVTDSSSLRTATKTQVEIVEKLKADLKDQEDLANVKDNEYRTKLAEAQTETKKADINYQKALSDNAGLRQSEATLKNIVAEREKTIVEQAGEVKKYRTEAIANEQLAKQLADRSQDLLEQITKLGLELARQKALGGSGVAEGPTIQPRNTGNEANPPSNMVKGRVERVDTKDSTLVQINKGTDDGLAKNHTMEVFRTAPAPKYLGMIRIVDASPHHSVGRLIVPPGVTRPVLVEGDLVWSKLR